MTRTPKSIFILEGIATSGKTALAKEIEARWQKEGLQYLHIDENRSLMPILENTDPSVAIKFLTTLLDEVFAQSVDAVLFDRLYMTHVFRTHGTLVDFRAIEDRLRVLGATLVLLTVPEAAVMPRIQSAMAHRPTSWSSYVQKKGDAAAIERYYVEQQRELRHFIETSELSSRIFDTTQLSYAKIAEQLLDTNL